MNNRTWTFLTFLLPSVATCSAAGDFKVGVARTVITPQQDMWLGGYASRTTPSEGKIHELYAKALAFEDQNGTRSVLVTTDLLGLPRAVATRVAADAQTRFGLSRERLILSFSHTHSGPVIGGDRLVDMYGLDAEQQRRVDDYTAQLPGRLLQTMEAALADLGSCRAGWGVGRATFAMNRRQYTTNGVVGGINPIGPVDHDVPVLVITRPDGSIKAIVHGYACHNTTLDLPKVCGDYAGFSQAYLERKVPGAVALFVAGCGADANPHPRRTVALAEQYGEELGAAVLAVLREHLSDVRGPITAAFEEIPLSLSTPPSREVIQKQLASNNIYEQRRARRLLEQLDSEGSLPRVYPYPVQFWRFGDTLQLPVLGGEVVADYSLKLKAELGRQNTWVIGYANDFMAYIPSLRVLREGGYEGGDSMVYFGHHGPWAPPIETDILGAIRRLSAATRP